VIPLDPATEIEPNIDAGEVDRVERLLVRHREMG